MIYFDNAATAMPKAPPLGQAMAWAVERFGNPGRSFAPPGMLAAREIFAAREAVAQLVHCADPALVAFTSGATESMNLLCRLLGPGDHAIVTENEHNAVLRPLYQSGCAVDVLPCDGLGNLCPEALPPLLRPNTRMVFAAHGSNVMGNLMDARALHALCQEAGIPLVLDVAQTLGEVPVDLTMGDILCFSGHKGLLGPMGVGGLILRPGLELPVLKTGGTGFEAFAPLQQARMPDLAEAGTPNAPGIYGLLRAVEFLEGIGLPGRMAHQEQLTRAFCKGLSEIPGVSLYGDFTRWPRLPVVSFALEGRDSAQVALELWGRFEIVLRPGSHCAPLLHRRLGTENAGLARCSFGWFNTLAEIRLGLEAIRDIAKGR